MTFVGEGGKAQQRGKKYSTAVCHLRESIGRVINLFRRENQKLFTKKHITFNKTATFSFVCTQSQYLAENP